MPVREAFVITYRQTLSLSLSLSLYFFLSLSLCSYLSFLTACCLSTPPSSTIKEVIKENCPSPACCYVPSCRHSSATHLIWCRQLTTPSPITAINVCAQPEKKRKKCYIFLDNNEQIRMAKNKWIKVTLMALSVYLLSVAFHGIIVIVLYI